MFYWDITQVLFFYSRICSVNSYGAIRTTQ